jgi:hypothetical protein
MRIGNCNAFGGWTIVRWKKVDTCSLHLGYLGVAGGRGSPVTGLHHWIVKKVELLQEGKPVVEKNDRSPSSSNDFAGHMANLCVRTTYWIFVLVSGGCPDVATIATRVRSNMFQKVRDLTPLSETPLGSGIQALFTTRTKGANQHANAPNLVIGMCCKSEKHTKNHGRCFRLCKIESFLDSI